MSHPDATGIAGQLAQRLDPGRGVPLSSQIVDELWLAVVGGVLESGDRLPTVRQLAIELGVSPRTVELAYAQLERLGVVSARAGEGIFVSLSPPSRAERERYVELERLGREAAARAGELGFSIDDLIDLLAELRPERRLDEGGGE
jgi:DNA-binding transcriptional regulator YhcF (GntR family)